MAITGDSDSDDAFGGNENGVFEQIALIQHRANEVFGFEPKNKQARATSTGISAKRSSQPQRVSQGQLLCRITKRTDRRTDQLLATKEWQRQAKEIEDSANRDLRISNGSFRNTKSSWRSNETRSSEQRTHGKTLWGFSRQLTTILPVT
jgi:hypothetical protein